ncbi:hypothetical protein Tco_0959719, partial [Tanacetum coccineum]
VTYTSHKASLKYPKKKSVPLLNPYGRFTKMIVYSLRSTSDVHKRPESPFHLLGDDFLLEDTDNFGDQFLYDKPTEDDQEKSKVVNESDSTIPDPSHQTVTTTLPEITPFIALQLRMAKLEQDMSEVKKTDHSAAILASIKSQVPIVVDKYLGTKLDDALLRILE